MAMTKKERAEFDAAIERAEMLAALRWTAPVEPDVLPPEMGWDYTEGWTFSTYNGGRVWQKWSDRFSNGDGPAPRGKEGYIPGASKGAMRLYSTRARALAAMRYEMEHEFARKLLAVDRQLKDA